MHQPQGTRRRRLTLGSREVLWLFALCLQLLRTDTFFDYTNSDRNHQVQATANALAGHGLTSAYVESEDLSHLQYEPLGNWPPGYSLMIAPVYALTGDWFVSIELLHGLGLIAIFFLMYRWWRVVATETPPRAEYLFLAFWAFSFAPFQYLGTTDLWAGYFVLLAGYLLLRSEGGAWPWLIASLLAFGAAMSLRYACYTYAVVPTLYLLLAGKKKRALPALLLMVVIMLPLLYVQMQQSGGARYETFLEGDGAPYWSHLLRFDLFPLKAYCYLSVDKLAGMVHVSGVLLWGILLLPALALFAPVFMHWTSESLGLIRQQQGDPLRRWALFSGLVTGITLAFLAYLSLRYREEIYADGTWTYVEESRYYLPVLVLLQLWIPVLITSQTVNRWVRAFLSAAIVCFGLFVLFHTGSRLWEYGGGSRRSASGSEYETSARAIHAESKRLAAHPDPVVYVYGATLITEKMQLVAGWSGAGSISLEQLKRSARSTHPVSLMAFLSPGEFQTLQALPAFIPYADKWGKRYGIPGADLYVLEGFEGI